MSIRIERGDADYEQRRRAIVWNERVPDRHPAEIVRPGDAAEVAATVRAASAAGRRVAVRSGGHNWLGASLRDDSVLLDLGELNQVEVDVAGRRATVGPGATHQILADAIVPHGLAFPIGHCPSVGLGGYLLAGGSGWNLREWGPACWSVEAADVVLASGEEVRIDAEGQPDLYWALRGGSSAFPGVVTRFHVRLQPLPQIRSRRLAFPLSALSELVPWVAERLAADRGGLEISLIARSPATDPSAPPRAMVVGTGFGADEEEATERLEAGLAGIPGEASEDSGAETVALNELEGEGGWQEGLRYAADTCWVSGRYDEVGRLVADAIEASPSPLSRIVLAFGLSPEGEPDVAYTRFGKLTVNLYATWESADEDDDNVEWVRRYMRPFDNFKDGHYIGETDLSASPFRLKEAYPAEKWERLEAIVAEHDPDRRFHGFVGND